MNSNPPPIIDSAKVIVFARNDADVEYTDKINLHVGTEENDFKRIGELPNLAISAPYSTSGEYLLMLCNENWQAQGVICFSTIEEAKIKAEKGYKGILSKWQESSYNKDEVSEFLRNEYEVDPKFEWWTSICSFCGKKD